MLDRVRHIILVLSGKGGVGKSTVSSQLALTLKDKGFKLRPQGVAYHHRIVLAVDGYTNADFVLEQVGLLDIDLCGPSIPYILNLEGSDVNQCPEGWVPVYADEERRLAVMSIGFLLENRNDAVVWRGPKKTSMIKTFLEDVHWEDLDYLIIDTPPGTSDEHITVMENLKTIKCDGAILVTTPQQVAIEDVRKELTFCRKTGINILGIIENMSGYVCPTCDECTNIFSTGGGESLAEYAKVPFLGRLPIDPRVGKLAGTGKSAAADLPDSETAKAFIALVDRLTSENN